MKLMTSKNPDADISAWVASEGDYKPCENTFSLEGSSTKTSAKSTNTECPPNFYPVLIQASFCTVSKKN
jgi:hypothetical protein